MLQRSVPAVLQWAPALSSSGWCHLQQTAQQIASPTSNPSNSNSASSSLLLCHGPQQQIRSVYRASVDMRQQPRRARTPYFNPEDGPEAYKYWKDLWAKQQKPPKPQKPRRLPVYLEPEEQQQLIAAAAAAGVPAEVTQGDLERHPLPRLISAIMASGGRIPTDPALLQQRISDLFALEREVPGLDVLRIFKSQGFGILESANSQVKNKLAYLSKSLSKAGVSAEPGLLLTAAVKPALKYPAGLIDRARKLPQIFGSTLDMATPAKLMTHPFKANLLNKASNQLEKRLKAMAIKYGKPGAAALYDREPQLLMYRTAVLRRKIAALEEAVGLTTEQAYVMLWRQPRLLTYAAETLVERVEGLRDLLRVGDDDEGQQQFRWIVTNRPALLNKKPETIASKLETLASELNISADDAAAIVRKIPCLAGFSIDSLKAPMQTFNSISNRSVLAGIKTNAREIIRSQPSLLLLIEQSDDARSSLRGRLQLIDKVADISGSWRSFVGQWAAAAGSEEVADTLTHRCREAPVRAADCNPAIVERLEWILQQQQQQQQSVEPPGVDQGVYGLVTMKELEFEVLYPGFLAHKREQQEARAAAVEAEKQQRAAVQQSVRDAVAAVAAPELYK